MECSSDRFQTPSGPRKAAPALTEVGEEEAERVWRKFIYSVTIIVSRAMTVTNRIWLGPRETRLLFDLESRGKTVFTLRDAREILSLPGTTAADVVYRLKRKGRVIEIRKGMYLLVPAKAGLQGAWSESVFQILDFLLRREEYYVGFWSAMNYWGMTEQVPRIVHVVAPARRRGFEFQGQRVQFVFLKPGRIFGYTTEPVGPATFRISDRERTLLDGLLRPRYCGGVGEVAKAIVVARSSLDWEKLGGYVRRLGVDAATRRLGYLLDVLDVRVALRRNLAQEFRGLRWLDPSGPKERLGYSDRWGLILNVPREELGRGGGF